MKVRFRQLIAALVAAAACAASVPVRAADPVEVSVIIPLTGPGAFLGREEQQTLEAVEARVNASGGIRGRPLHFAFADDQSTPRTAVQLLAQVVGRHPPIVLGSTLSAICSAMAPMAKSATLQYCFSPGIRPEPGSTIFSASFATKDLLAVTIRYLRLRGLRRIALITSTDTTGQEAERSVDEALALPENAGTSVVDREHFNTADLSADAQLTRIKNTGANVVIAWSTGTSAGTLLRAANDAGITLPVVTSNGNLTYAQMQQYSGFLPNELIFPAGPAYAPDEIADPAVKRTVEAYLAAFRAQGVKPDNGHSLAWDAGNLIAETLRRLGPDASADHLRDALNGVRGYTGINGSYDFRAHPQRGLGESGVVMVRWDPRRATWAGISKPGGAPL